VPRHLPWNCHTYPEWLESHGTPEAVQVAEKLRIYFDYPNADNAALPVFRTDVTVLLKTWMAQYNKRHSRFGIASKPRGFFRDENNGS